MKAKERIMKYGLKKYLLKCRNKDISASLIAEYQNKYGFEINLGKVTRYSQTYWKMELSKEGEPNWKGTSASGLHAKPDYLRDEEEAFRNAEKAAGSSGWKLVSAKKVGRPRYVYYETSEQRVEYKTPSKQTTLTESLHDQRVELGKVMRESGYSAGETLEAIRGMK